MNPNFKEIYYMNIRYSNNNSDKMIKYDLNF